MSAQVHRSSTKVHTWRVGSGGFIGSVSLVPIDMGKHWMVERVKRQSHPLMLLTWFFVHPLRRGRGWSHLLLGAALTWADKEGIDVWLYVAPYGTNRAAGRLVHKMDEAGLERLYRQYGFRRVRAAQTGDIEMVRRCQALKS